jgi:hypothetical protein
VYLRLVSRHVLHVEAKGLPFPWRVRRQRALLSALAQVHRPLYSAGGGWSGKLLRPARSFAFSVRTTPEDAVATIAGALDDVDTSWRRYLKVWDGFPNGVGRAVRA